MPTWYSIFSFSQKHSDWLTQTIVKQLREILVGTCQTMHNCLAFRDERCDLHVKEDKHVKVGYISDHSREYLHNL